MQCNMPPMTTPFCDFQTPWFRLIGEHLPGEQGERLDYWRVERSHSVIILPQQNQRWILPPAVHRPGAGVSTWDFPGGRALAQGSLLDSALAILWRELQVPAAAVAQCIPLNADGWWVNSSFSNQKLYGFFAEIVPEYVIPPQAIGAIYDQSESDRLLNQLDCLQCRSLLQHWFLRSDS